MADKTKSQYRVEILSLRRKLKPELQERISKHLFDWRERDEAHWFENLIWRTCDNYGKEKLNCRFTFINDSVEQYRKLWHMLEPLTQNQGMWREFEDRYFEPELAAREEPTDNVLLRRFVYKLSSESLALLVKLFDRLGGFYFVSDVNEQGETIKVRAKDYWFMHPDLAEATKEKLSMRAVELNSEEDERSGELLKEMVSPFLQLTLKNRRGLLDATPDAFKLWEAEDFIPHLTKKIESNIRQERDALTKVNEENINVDKERRLVELTRLANKEALRIANRQKKDNGRILYSSIAEQMMMKYFKGLIPRETGRQTRNNQMILTKEWKDKREAIRGTLREKLKKK